MMLDFEPFTAACDISQASALPSLLFEVDKCVQFKLCKFSTPVKGSDHLRADTIGENGTLCECCQRSGLW